MNIVVWDPSFEFIPRRDAVGAQPAPRPRRGVGSPGARQTRVRVARWEHCFPESGIIDKPGWGSWRYGARSLVRPTIEDLSLSAPGPSRKTIFVDIPKNGGQAFEASPWFLLADALWFFADAAKAHNPSRQRSDLTLPIAEFEKFTATELTQQFSAISGTPRS